MTKITQLPVVSTMADQSVFVVVDNGVTKKLTYSALKTTLKGDKGETGETGAKGDTGAQGDKGDKGEIGLQGPVGPLAPFSTATDIRLGGIKIGTGVSVAVDGTLSVPIVTITTATASSPGVVTPGAGLQLIGPNAALTLNARLSRPAYKELRIVASAGNNSGYGIEGLPGSNPAVTGILPGSTVAFVIPNQPAHPLQIRTSPGGAAVTEGDWLWVSNTGTNVTGAGAYSVGRYNGTLFWTVPEAPSQSVVYYQCINHAGMLGSIAIKNDAQIIDSRITSTLGAVAQDILPDGNNTRNLGSATKRWNTLSVGQAGININGSQLTYSSGKLAASGGFELGKSIVRTNLTSAGSFRSAPAIKITDATGSGFQATTSIVPTAIDALTYTVLDTTSTYWFRPADTVTIEFVGGGGAGAQASADMGLYIKSPVLSYNSPPTASLVFANQTTLNAQAQLQISDAQIVQRLADFLAYIPLTELRDGLPTFLDPQVNQTKALKFIDVDIPSGVVTFDINLAFSTIPAGTYIFEVPRLVIADGNYPLICETVQVGKLVASAGQYSWYLANRLDEGRLPNGIVEGSFVPVSCSALDNAGQPGYWYLSSNLDGTQKNKTEVLYGVRAVNLDNGGSNYTQAPTFNIKANGVTKVQGSSVLLASPVSGIDITSFGSSYTPTASVVLQGRHTGTLVTVPTSDANMWRVTTSFYPLSVARTPGVTIYVHNVDVTGSATPSNGQRIRNATTGELLPGTIVSVSSVWNTSNIRLYQVNMSQSVTVANADYITFGNYEAEITPEQRVAEPVLLATTTKPGVVQADGTTIVVNNGVISAVGGGGGGMGDGMGDVLGPVSSTNNAIARFNGAGGKSIQSSLVTIQSDGAITAPIARSVIPFHYDSQTQFPSATTYHGAIAHSHADGRMYFAHSGNWLAMANLTDVGSQTVATSTVLGGVKIGSNVNVAVDGTISVADPYSLVTATSVILGGIKLGSGLQATGLGVVSVNTATLGLQNFTLPTASNSVLGGVKVDASTITINGSGVITANYTTYTLPTASGSVLGGVKIGTGLSIDGNGVVSASGGGVSNFSALTDATTAGLTVDETYLQAITRLVVTNNASSSYSFDQYSSTNPTIYAISGLTIAFNLNVIGHPFLIRTSGGVNYNTGLIHVSTSGVVSTGSAAQGQTSGTLYWKIPIGTTGNYQYICSIHAGMVGVITIKDLTVI